MSNKILVFAIVSVLTISCTNSAARYEKMINYVVRDSSLAGNLMYADHPEGEKNIRDGNFKYSVHSLMNSSMFDYKNSSCFAKVENSKKVISTLMSSLNTRNKDLKKYSSADTASVHLFFTESVANVQGLAVFYRSPNTYNYSYDLLYNKPLDFIWDRNRGVFYLFTFDKNTAHIKNVCKEIVVNE